MNLRATGKALHEWGLLERWAVMGKFLEEEKLRYVQYKNETAHLSQGARSDGLYKGKLRPFCLPRDHAEENLFPGIRNIVPNYFAKYEIKWHDGQDRRPSNHLCDSQICCVNFLMPFADQPRALAEVLRPLFPELKIMLPIENGQYVACEWIGAENYLNEIMSRNGKRTRGANFTSADAAVMFERNNGEKQIVLIEWKYTESYGETSYKVAKSGRDRIAIYQALFDRVDCPINKKLLPDFGALFYEPFYQFMRQQLLAHEMEQEKELGANIVSLLHIAPARNSDFHRVTSSELRGLGNSAIDIWKKLVISPERFTSVSTEHLFGNLSVERLPEMQAWLAYINDRYAWVRQHT